MFVLAARISKVSEDVHQEESLLQQRQPQCLLAAIACDMRNLESLGNTQLRKVLEVIDQCEACLDDGGQNMQSEVEYLVCSPCIWFREAQFAVAAFAKLNPRRQNACLQSSCAY